jgi:glycosyltransferase involved in cell wall biosynthesis
MEISPTGHFFDGVTLLITHYNRPASLRRLLTAFRQAGCRFADIVVSDDGSRAEHQLVLHELRQQFGFQLITTPVNRGLGHNLNKGQDAVRTPFTLYVQEDFVPKPAFASTFGQGLQLMQYDASLDLIRFYAYYAYPYLTPYQADFDEMICRPWGADYAKIYVYSDHPHLRRSSFFAKFGRYAEGRPGDRTEYRMCLSFIRNKGRALFYRHFRDVLEQVNNTVEPSTMHRQSWTQSDHPVVVTVRDVYRTIRYNFDINK